VEYADVKVLVDVGLRNSNNDNNAVVKSISMANEESGGASTSQPSPYSFWESLPPHDCLVLTDSTLESMGCLPMYVEGMRRAFQKRQESLNNANASSAAQQQQQRRGSARKLRGEDNDSNNNNSETFVLPIYATFPTVKMGQMSLYDHHANISLDGGSPPYTLEEMDMAIAMLRTIKYSQTLTLPLAETGATSGNSSNNMNSNTSNVINPTINPRLSVTAHRAGHVVGGAFYKLERLRDETSVVITGNAYHIAKELHLDACTLLKNGEGTDVLVTRPGGPAFPLVNGLYSSSGKSKDTKNKNKKMLPTMMISPLASRARRDLTERVLGFLRRDANVLLPVDASGRALELVLLFNRFWSKQNLAGSYNLIWFGSMVHNTLDFTRSQLEWMNSSLGNNIYDSSHNSKKGGSDHGQHPYLLKHVKLCTNMAELDKVLAESNDSPTCVLANGLTLDHGPARDLFLRWADNDNNAVIFTDSSQCKEREIAIAGNAFVGGAAAAAIGGDATNNNLNNPNNNASSLEAGGTSGTPIVTLPSKGVATTDDEAEGGVDHSIEDDMIGTAITEDEASRYTASYQLLKHWSLAKAEDREMDDVLNVDALVPRRKPLVGNELSTFLEKEEAARVAQRKREEEQAMLREVELAKGRLRLGEDTGTNPSIGGGGNLSSLGGVNSSSGNGPNEGGSSSASKVAQLPFFRQKKKSRFDSSLFLKFSKPLHLTFELREDAVGVGQRDVTARFGIGESIENSEVLEDDYGIAVLPDQFRDIVTGVDPSKFGAQKDEINKRGLGFASSGGGTNGSGGKGDGTKSTKKRNRKENLGLGGTDDSGTGNVDGDEDEDDIDERGMEAIDLSEGQGIIRGRNGRPPTKVSTVNRRIEVVAEIDYIPFEGRVDSRSARQSVRALTPRHVVVLGGTNPKNKGNNDSDAMDVDKNAVNEDSQMALSPESVLLVDEVQALADAAKGFVVSQEDPVMTPSDSETVELRVGHHAYPARLVATPFRTKEERLTEEVVPDPIELVETKIGSCTVSMLDFVMTGQKVALDGSIVIAPKNKSILSSSSASSSRQLSIFEQENQRPPVYVSDGEVLLTDLRTELIVQHGMKAEYSAQSDYSQLIVNGRIIVKKWFDAATGSGTNSSNNDKTPGEIDVEGPLCEDFFTVRSVVCNQYVTL
jgi:cleavage and polyadenylation specificity factor subunit 2